MHKRLVFFLSLLLVAVSALGQTQARGPLGAPGLDGELVQLSRQVPGFGGYFFDDDGDLNVYLKDLRQEPGARAALAEVVRNRPERSKQPWSRPAEIVVRRGQFDFAQLDEWRGRVAAVAAMNGIHVLDTDEAANRIFVGVADEETQARVLSRLDAIGVPRNAVVVAVEPPVTPVVSLRNHVRPLVGGLQIDWRDAQGHNTFCTLGVNLWYTNTARNIPTGTPGFFTASHCSATQGNTDNTVYSQGGTRIGFERWDAPFINSTRDTRCPPNTNCRYADVTFVQYDAGVDRYQGGLAQTLFRGFDRNQNGSIDLNPDAPTFRIIGNTSPAVGSYLNKVGRTSGWTSGQVSRTCADYTFNGIVTLCQDQVEADADGGDSGSPVFTFVNDSDARFAGIVWAQTSEGGFIFSNRSRIQAHLGGGMTYPWY